MAKTKTKDTLHVGLLVDESGSMCGNEPAVVGGINEFVAKLAADQNGTKVLATLGMFDTHGNDPVVRAKFEQHAEIREVLLGTGDAEIIENAPGDYYWGIGSRGTGKNMLGIILMEVRAELRAELRAASSIEVGEAAGREAEK